MKRKYLILFLSAAMCNSVAVMPVMAAQEPVSTEASADVDQAASEADSSAESEDGDTAKEKTDSSAEEAVEDKDPSQETDASENSSEGESFMDVEERKAIDDKAKELQEEAGYVPVEILDDSSSASSIEADQSEDSDYDTVDVEALTDDAAAVDSTVLSDAAAMDIYEYISLATQMEDVKEGDVISTKMTYAEDGMYFDIETLSGFTDYRGAFSIDVVDDSDTVLYTIAFPEDAWNEENVLDLAADVQSVDDGVSLSFNSTQDLSFIASVSIPSVKENTRYVLTDEDGSEYSLQTSDETGKVTFEMSEFRNYTVKDASDHKYDAMDPASSSQNDAGSFISRYKMVIIAAAVSVCMVIAACVIPARKRRK